MKYREDYYATHLPTCADILLLIEVADTSIEYDRTVKLPSYAHSGISEVWIVDLNTNVIEADAWSAIGEYELKQEYIATGIVQIHSFAGLTIQAPQILG